MARRAAPTLGALVAPPINYALSYRHVGFTGLVHVRIPTFMALVEDVAVSLATAGFKRIVFLNGHYDNSYAIAYACANAADKLPRGVKAFSHQLLGRHVGRRGSRVHELAKGSAANRSRDGSPSSRRRIVGTAADDPRVQPGRTVAVSVEALLTASVLTSLVAYRSRDRTRPPGPCD